VLGEEHPDTLTVASELALSLTYQGKYSDAERIQREVLDASRALLSVSAVADKGWRFDFNLVQPIITKDAMTLYFKRRGGLYILEGEVQVMPLESPDANEKNEHLSEDVKEQVTEAQTQELALPEKPDDATPTQSYTC
jgi:hypothetical protein